MDPGNLRFTRISSANVALSAHVREDSHFVILPVMKPSAVTGWVVYDATTGQIVSPAGKHYTLPEAKEWLTVTNGLPE